MFRLEPYVQHYDWGSQVALPRLTGRAPGERPEAEFWYGAHEQGPSAVPDEGTDLASLFAADPAGLVGKEVLDRFGGRFPFLLKILAPTKSLSIQCHPTAEQVLSAPAGTYGDGWPKPEAFVAIAAMEAFIGMRAYGETRELLTGLDVPELTAIVEWASGQDAPGVALLEALLTLDLPVRNALVRSVSRAIAGRDDDPAFAAVRRVAEQFPGDIGLVVVLTMQHRIVRPGEYVYVPAGCLHAYQRGVAVEVMANSDNVIRAGLTAKAIDIPELLRIVDPERQPADREPAPGRISDFGADTEYFRLFVVGPGFAAETIPAQDLPRIGLALHDPLTLRSGGRALELASGDGVYLLPGEQVTVEGSGALFLATTGQ